MFAGGARSREIRAEVIEDYRLLHALTEEWTGLHAGIPGSTVFQTPEWLLTWWRHFGSGTLRTFVFRSGGRLVGILPAFLHPWNGRRQLTLIGTGLSDYLEPLVEEQYSETVVALLAEQLRAFQDWDLCHWQDLEASTPLQTLGQAQEDTPSSVLRMEGSFASFMEGRPRHLRKNLRRCQEAAARIGDLEFRVTAEANGQLLHSVMNLHERRWRAMGTHGVISANQAAAFIEDVAAVLGRRNLLRFFSLHWNGEVVAIILAFCGRHTIYGYLTAFHPEYARYGFGNELLFRSLAYAHKRGCRWDFLRGEEQYKFDWGACRIPKRRVTIERGSLA